MLDKIFFQSYSMHKIKTFLCFIFELSCLFLRIESFIHRGLMGHSAVLVENKLYFFGGNRYDASCSNVVFYLDVSESFSFADPPLVYFTENIKIPFGSCWGTALLNRIDQII